MLKLYTQWITQRSFKNLEAIVFEHRFLIGAGVGGLKSKVMYHNEGQLDGFGVRKEHP